jgi:hypothetical protein
VMKEHSLRVFKNRVLKKKVGYKKQEATGG